MNVAKIPESRFQIPNDTKLGTWNLESGIWIFCLFFLLLPLAYAFEIPLNDGFVTDTASVLSSSEEQQLEDLLKAYRDETSNEIAILIVPSLQGEVAADIAVEVGREWRVGTAENDNGILMLVSYEDREIFIATGYGLEGAVPDLVAKGIIEEDILPHFREGQYFEGVLAGTESLKKHIGGEYTAERYQHADVSALPWEILLFIGFILFEALAAFFGRSRSWWLGGILGVIAGLVLTFLFTWWLSVPVLALIGLLFDYFASRFYTPAQRRRSGRHRGFWTGGGRGGSGGGFGGFSGGSFGGGGAGGRW